MFTILLGNHIIIVFTQGSLISYVVLVVIASYPIYILVERAHTWFNFLSNEFIASWDSFYFIFFSFIYFTLFLKNIKSIYMIVHYQHKD